GTRALASCHTKQCTGLSASAGCTLKAGKKREQAMCRVPRLYRAVLITCLVAFAGEMHAQQNIPDFTSASFGWLVSTGFDYRPVEGTVAPVGADVNWRGGI